MLLSKIRVWQHLQNKPMQCTSTFPLNLLSWCRKRGRGERINALIRKFIQVLLNGGEGATEFTAGGMYLLGEVGSFVTVTHFPCWSNTLVIPGLWSTMINHKTKEDSYDARKRDPQFVQASSSPLWELLSFLFLILSFPILNLCRSLSSIITTPQSRSMPVNSWLPNHSQPPQISLELPRPVRKQEL